MRKLRLQPRSHVVVSHLNKLSNMFLTARSPHLPPATPPKKNIVTQSDNFAILFDQKLFVLDLVTALDMSQKKKKDWTSSVRSNGIKQNKVHPVLKAKGSTG